MTSPLAVDMFVKRGVSEAMIDVMDEDHSGSIDRVEFLTYMLTTMGKVDKEDITKILGVFDALDLDGSGSIDKEVRYAPVLAPPEPELIYRQQF